MVADFCLWRHQRAGTKRFTVVYGGMKLKAAMDPWLSAGDFNVLLNIQSTIVFFLWGGETTFNPHELPGVGHLLP
jgi:hypothetical protein